MNVIVLSSTKLKNFPLFGLSALSDKAGGGLLVVWSDVGVLPALYALGGYMGFAIVSSVLYIVG